MVDRQVGDGLAGHALREVVRQAAHDRSAGAGAARRTANTLPTVAGAAVALKAFQSR
ncbi:hypothetical protein [Amycolatopsis methanolica]|uniref:hypothetical protein n=1 Tax=Amycolatopsis methanolica TaxID=1814 RepID=UPI00036E1143|nr:hypothetical protein [Amycolatopsis methanolica]